MSDDQLPIPNVRDWQLLYEPGAQARCIKDSPPMYGFGRPLKIGDIVDVQRICWRGKYEIAVEKQCAFYQLEGFFEVVPPKDPRDPDHSRNGIFVHHNCWRCKDGADLSRCPTPDRPGNCGYPQARND